MCVCVCVCGGGVATISQTLYYFNIILVSFQFQIKNIFFYICATVSQLYLNIILV